MEVALHRTPRWREVMVEHIRIVGLCLRREMQVFLTVLGTVTVMIVVASVRGGARTWFDSEEWMPIAIASFVLPFAVWKREKRFGPGFLWTLPVDRRRLALARVFGGWVWLIVALAVYYVWESLLSLAAGVEGARIVSPLMLPGATAMYLLGSAVVVGLRYPLRWLFGVAGAIALSPYLVGYVGLEFSDATAAADRAMPLVAVVWLGAGLAAVWLAVSRHAERRRR